MRLMGEPFLLTKCWLISSFYHNKAKVYITQAATPKKPCFGNQTYRLGDLLQGASSNLVGGRPFMLQPVLRADLRIGKVSPLHTLLVHDECREATPIHQLQNSDAHIKLCHNTPCREYPGFCCIAESYAVLAASNFRFIPHTPIPIHPVSNCNAFGK